MWRNDNMCITCAIHQLAHKLAFLQTMKTLPRFSPKITGQPPSNDWKSSWPELKELNHMTADPAFGVTRAPACGNAVSPPFSGSVTCQIFKVLQFWVTWENYVWLCYMKHERCHPHVVPVRVVKFLKKGSHCSLMESSYIYGEDAMQL